MTVGTCLSQLNLIAYFVKLQTSYDLIRLLSAGKHGVGLALPV